MDITYMTPKVIDVAIHKCTYLLEISNGKVIAVCRKCGKWLEYNEIIRRINSDGLR